MTNLKYSAWHRTLGFSFFAMDVDYIEIRNNMPVAVIESSLCTRRYTSCTGPTGVFNRFLSETGGFQLEMAYWVSRWLRVPAFVVCLESISQDETLFHVLCLSNGDANVLNRNEYEDFLRDLPEYSSFFPNTTLELPQLLEKLIQSYPGLVVYPYFRKSVHRDRWMDVYSQRCSEIERRVRRNRLDTVPNTVEEPVKRETTHTRPRDYEEIRSRIDFPYFNLEWVEWRKDYLYQPIGRPAALIKSQIVECEPDQFIRIADESYALFIQSDESELWNNVSERMCVDWFYVAYLVYEDQLGPHFKVWNNNRPWVTTLPRFTDFIKTR
jgi:hypothetical protein